MKYKKWFWGAFFILAAAFIICSQLGILATFSIWTLLLTVLLAAIVIHSVVHVEFFGIFVPLAVILILFDTPLGIEALTPWPVLGAAVLLSIGLSILFRSKLHRGYKKHGCHSAGVHETVEDLNEDRVACKMSFGSGIKYLHAQNLEQAEFDCSFGSLKIYFDQAKLNPNGADVLVNCSFASITFYVPHEWKVIDHIEASMGGVKNRENRSASDTNIIRLRGNVSFGSVEVVYI